MARLWCLHQAHQQRQHDDDQTAIVQHDGHQYIPEEDPNESTGLSALLRRSGANKMTDRIAERADEIFQRTSRVRHVARHRWSGGSEGRHSRVDDQGKLTTRNVAILGEVLNILRPFVYAVLRRRGGRKRWTPLLMSLLVDLAAWRWFAS